jgi:hypothetical protein
MTITFHTAYFLNAVATQFSNGTPFDIHQCPHCTHVTTTNVTVTMYTSYELFFKQQVKCNWIYTTAGFSAAVNTLVMGDK